MKHFKLFFALFAMLALGVGNAWAESETVTFTNKDWAPWTKITSGSSFESASPSRGVANNGVNGSCKSSKSYSNITKISYVASSNTTGGKVTIKVGETTVGESSIPKENNKTFEYVVDNLSGVITLSVTKPSSKTVYVKSITIETSTATPTPVDPTVTFSNGSYTVGQTLDLSSLWTSNSDGAVTYSIVNAGTTGASLSGSLFTATAAGTCTVKASQAATNAYNAIEKTATITITVPTPATITLSEAGQEKTVEGKYVGDSYTLPSTSSHTCGTKTFVGWSTVEIATPGNKPTTNFYEPDASVTLDASNTFYAVFAESGGTSTTSWVKTDISNITSNDEVVITMSKGETTWALRNDNGTTDAPVAEAMTIKNEQIASDVGNVTTWIILKDGNNLTFYQDETKKSWLYCTNSNDGVRVGNNTNKVFTIDGYYLKHTVTSRYVGVYVTNPDWRCYDNTTGNIAGQTLAFYKKTTTGGNKNYTTSCVAETPATDLTDEQFNWSTTTANAFKGANDNTFPTLIKTVSVPVTYESSNTTVATIAADGNITLVAPGTTTISAIFAGGEVGGTTYAAKTVTYTLTVKQLVSCSEVYDLADNATFVLKDFVVTYVNGKYTYIKDNTGYGLIYGEYGLKAGDIVASGKLEASKTTYNGLVEIIPTTAANELGATAGTAPDPEVKTVIPTNADINKYVKFEGISFDYTQLNSTHKSNTGKLNGESITFYNTFGVDETFDTSKKYDVVGCVSIHNTLQVNFISAEEVAEPTLNISKSSLDFGKVKSGSTTTQTFTIQGSQLTKDVTLEVVGDHFTVSHQTLTPAEGSLNQTITVTYNPTTEGNHSATLKVTSDELTEQTISLQGNAVAEYTVHFYVNKEEDTELAKQVLSGDKLDAMPAEPTSCDPLNYPTFIGWSTSEINGTTDVEPTDLLDLNTVITSDCNYYAVFAKPTTTSGGTGSVTMAYNVETTVNMVEGNNAATVELDENEWSVVPNKGDANNMPGLNKAKDIRVYGVETGVSNTLTITSANQIITDVIITYTSKSYNTGTVSVNGNNLTPTSSSDTEATYAINASSFVIGNSTKTQVRIKSVVINYATSTTTYTYLTTCESATPTYTVTYDLDGGESTCETSVVVEQNGELTLCDAPTKKGHTFLTWKDQSDNKYEAGATITVSSNLTLTAQWQKESYKVTWTSLGEEVASANVEYNSQPTKPEEDPTYTCLLGAKEFVGWTTQEIAGVGVPVNLYTDEFPVVTEAVTYYAVFAGKSTEASVVTNTLLVTEKLGNYTSGSMKDDQQNVWNYFAGGLENTGTYYLALRNNDSETSYIESPKFVGTVQSIVAHVKNGSSSKVRTVYLRSSAITKPTEGDLGETSIPTSNDTEVNLNITSTFDKFYIQVSDGLQFHKIVVTSGIAAGAYIDYITSCEAVTSSITIEDVTMTVGDTHTITATVTPATAASAIKYTIKENEANAISLEGNTITALKEGTAIITATIEETVNYTGTTVDFTVTVNPAPITDKVVILAKHQGKWYAMKAEYVPEETDRLAAVPVYYVNGKLYNVSEEDKAAITWTRSAYGDNTVSFQNNGKYLKGKSSTTLILEANEDDSYKWDAADNTMLIEGTTRTFLYHKDGFFRNYSITLARETSPTYSALPVVTAPEFATGNVYTINASATNGTAKGAGMYVEGSTVTLMADPKMDHTFVNWTKGDEVVSTANPYVFEATKNVELVANFRAIPERTTDLTGTFSVGKYEVAQFATGNLQYNVKNKEWSFAKQQYQYIGDANINVGDPAFTGTIDLFGWSNGENNNFGANQSGNKNDYKGDFVDWGTLFPAEDNWSTLSHEQWDYLLNKRGAGKKQIARVGTVFGVMLFPDVWNAPLTVEAQYDNYFKINVYNYTLDQWTKLETAGAVFFPAAGRRYGGYDNKYIYDGITNLGDEYKLQYCTNDLAAYYTSTKHDDGERVSYLLNLGNGGAKYSTLELGWYEYGHVGQSVRLAKVTSTLVEIGDGDNTSVIEIAGEEVDVKVNRSFTKDKLYTISLPFALDAEQVKEIFGVGTIIYEFAKVTKEDEVVKLYFQTVSAIAAATPYLIKPAQNVNGFEVEDVTISTTPNNISFTAGATTIIMKPILSTTAGEKTNGTTEYWLAENTWLYNNANTIQSLRALFKITTVSGMPPRCRVALGENIESGVDNITSGENTTNKVIENGQLFIIRNGEKFNTMGIKF